MDTLELTVLSENTARGRGLLGEHGLAYWIETPAWRVLFDTGQGLVLERNAVRCGKRLEELEAVVLSHGHYDHVGALEAVVKRAPQAVVHAHPDVLKRRYSKGPGGRIHGVDEAYLHGGGLESSGVRYHLERGPVEVAKGLYATGEVPRETAYEDTGGDFFLDLEGEVIDPIADDQSLYFRSRDGVVLILGCAHAGVVNTMRRVCQLTGEERIHAVIGGMHLLHAGPDRLEATFAAFRSFGVTLLGPCHCTGLAAVAAFWQAFPGQCEEVHAGKIFRFEMPGG